MMQVHWCAFFDTLFQEEVIKAVEKVCTYLPSTLSGQCKDLVETYGQAIIELLVQQADPKTVCTVLALCNDAHRAYVGKLLLLRAHWKWWQEPILSKQCTRINKSWVFRSLGTLLQPTTGTIMIICLIFRFIHVSAYDCKFHLKQSISTHSSEQSLFVF